MTSFFPRFPASEFAPFFRLLDTADPFLQPRTSSRSFVPRFDVREIKSAYELHGEFPGFKQEDIEIEFVDANTLVIRGKSERQSTQTSGKGKGKAIEQPTVTESVAADTASEKSSSSYQKATVEEDDYVDAGAAAEGTEDPERTSTSFTEAAVAPSTSAVPTNNTDPDYKYWVSERSVGQFERRFSFPGRVDQEAVKASLANGILSVIVPKSVREEKKITIE
ncbi:MAG: hypothetical protein Q9195_007112 [Heterodermia aff. obscurata]